MRTDYKRGLALVNDLVAVVCLALFVGCSSHESTAPVSPAAPLEVVATVPVEGASDVPIEALISVTFTSEPDTNAIRGDILRVDGLAGEICRLGRTVTLQPTDFLDYARTYTVEIDSGLTDCDGRCLGGSFVWKFRTVDDPHLPDFPDPPARLPSVCDTGP